MTDEIQIILDLTGHQSRYDDLDDFVFLWNHVDEALADRTMAPGSTIAVEHSDGPIRLHVISGPLPHTTLSKSTPISVHSVLQAPEKFDRCRLCEQKGRVSYGPYRCSECQPERASVCDDHVVILEGKLDAYCNEHAPKSPTGEWATFWCFGPECRGKRAWSARDRAIDRRDIGLPYCRSCYEKKFPECWGKDGEACDRIGTLFCEHVDPNSEQTCGRRICSTHAERWQIYGPHDEGLSLCGEHGKAHIDSLDMNDIVYQIAAGSASRRLLKKRLRSRLPTLPAVKHTILLAHGEARKLNELFQSFKALTQNASTRLQRQMNRLITLRAAEWEKQVDNAEHEEDAGRAFFERVVEEYRKLNLPVVANSLQYSDYRPKNNVLYVLLDKDLIGMLMGKGGWAINEVQKNVDVNISLERGIRQRRRK